MKKDSDFSRYWQEQRNNQIIGLVVTMVICVVAGAMMLVFTIPVWIVIGLVFWGIRMRISFTQWRRENGNRNE